MLRSSRLLRDSMMQSTRVPNPVAVVNRYWPSRAHAPSFAYTMPSYRFSRRPFALGSEFSLPGVPTACANDTNCPPGTRCCAVSSQDIPEVGLGSRACLDEDTCWQLTNQLERALCAAHPQDSVLECDEYEGKSWCVCQGKYAPVEGQIEPPPETTKPPTGEPVDPVPAPAPSAAKSWTDQIDLPVVAVGGLAALVLLYAIAR